MKNLKRTILLLLAVVTLFGCAKEYDDSELRGRIESFEAWQKTVNDQIVALQGLVGALENKEYVTSVTELADKSGYVIAFSKSGSITIKHGQKGTDATAPVVGVKKDTDGKYYWTLDGEYIIVEGNKISTTGDKGEAGNNGLTPHIGTNGNWWIGTTDIGVKATGDKGDTGATGMQGDAIFDKDGVDLSDPDHVTFTLADGVTKITLPRTNSDIVGFDSYEVVEAMAGVGCPDINVVMPATETYTSIMAKIECNGGTSIDIKTRAPGSPWSAEIIKGADNKVSIRVTPAVDAQYGDVAILTVSIVTKTGVLASASRTIKFTTTPIIPIDNTYVISSASQLSWVISQMSVTDFTEGKTFELEADLDLTGYNWKPIGAQDDGINIQFVGIFDGKGHTIKGLDIKRNQNRHVGFFSFVGETGTVRNLNIEGTVTNTMHSMDHTKSISTGGIVGANIGAVINCSFKGNISSNNIFHTGGVVGVNQEGLVAGCSYIGSEGAMVRANGREGGHYGI